MLVREGEDVVVSENKFLREPARGIVKKLLLRGGVKKLSPTIAFCRVNAGGVVEFNLGRFTGRDESIDSVLSNILSASLKVESSRLNGLDVRMDSEEVEAGH